MPRPAGPGTARGGARDGTEERNGVVDELAAIKAIVANSRKTSKLASRKDRLLRFGADLVFALCEAQGIEIVIVNRGEQPSFEQEWRHPLLLGRGSVDVVRENSAELSRL